MTTPVEGVRQALIEHVGRLPGVPVLIGCSGGPDSLALVHLAVRLRESVAVTPVHACIVDHGLQVESAHIAERAVQAAAQLGADACHVRTVHVEPEGLGPEAAARNARRLALRQCATDIGAPEIWLGHTLDDQAETVLLGLARGSGARSLAGMAIRDNGWVRPFLHSRRADVHASLPADINPWQDPHNRDPRFLRSRVRSELMPQLVSVLGDRAVLGLARTAGLLRDDNAALEEMARIASGELELEHRIDGMTLSRDALRELPAAVRHRVLRRLLIEAGCPVAELTSSHYERIDAAIAGSGTVGPLALPNRVAVRAAGDRLAVVAESRGS